LQKYAPLAEETAGQYDHRLYLASAHRAWGVLHRLSGNYTEAEERLHQALPLFQELGARWQIGRTLAELGQVAAAQSNPDRARNYFTQALSLFNEMGAQPDADRLRVHLELLE
jgi:tetratricopeptide (TPR) repeat protein